MTLHYHDESVDLHHGDCLDVLKMLPDNSIDSCVTDPPYDLTSGAGGFMGQRWDATGVAFNPETWGLVFRVLKPGGYLLAFGGTRTFHRMACAIEDAGFEIRDSICWIYGSGFPKSMDVSRAIDKTLGAAREPMRFRPRADNCGTFSGKSDPRPGVELSKETGYHEVAGPDPVTDAAKQWKGWGTALKPSFEPIVVARKPFKGRVAENVLTHGVGAMNIDGCRIEATDSQLAEKYASVQNAGPRENSVYGKDARDRAGSAPHVGGRWPPNAMFDQEQAAELDRQSGVSASKAADVSRPMQRQDNNVYGKGLGSIGPENTYDDSGGASRFFPVFKYTAKAGSDERPSVDGVAHPTVKPVDLMRWLVRLVTPPHGVVLDPFAGSGTTGEAAIHEHLRAILIEREASYLPLIVARLSKPMEIGFDFG